MAGEQLTLQEAWEGIKGGGNGELWEVINNEISAYADQLLLSGVSPRDVVERAAIDLIGREGWEAIKAR